MDLKKLTRAPFHLDEAALNWVQRTFAGLSTESKIAQLMVVLCLDTSRENLETMCELGVGGIFRMPTRPVDRLREEAEWVQTHSRLPMLMCGDLEFSEGTVIGGADGTAFPNQMAVAAARDPVWAERMALVAAREGRAAGFNWSFTPVVDINANFRSTVVNTRSFGDNARRVMQSGRAYIAAMQREGMAACAKHWPGDGFDDRDQHAVTSVNPCGMDAWEATFGRIYRAMIRQGVLSVMSAHIALPAYPEAGYRPACISRKLNLELLRGRLKFNGVIISDASVMAGLSSQGPRARIVPELIEHGCDIILFHNDVSRDMGLLSEALADGRLSPQRLDDAVLRVLGLKAALGLHRASGRRVRPLSAVRRQEHARWARQCAEQGVTLVKDEQRLLPLSPEKHHRVLLVQPNRRANSFGMLPDLRLGSLLRERGLEVTTLRPDVEVRREDFDLIVYAVAEEAYLLKSSLGLNWIDLHGDVMRAMDRYWHEIPTVFVSFGSPYHLREVPVCPTFINAYSPVASVQEAVVRALLGQIPFGGRSPVILNGASFNVLEASPAVPFSNTP